MPHGQRVIAVRVDWEGKAATIVYVPAILIENRIVDDNDTISEYLSDQHGYLVRSWRIAGDE